MNTAPELAMVSGYIALAQPVGGFLPGMLLGVAPGASEAVVIGDIGGAVSASSPAPAPTSVAAASIDGLAGHTFSASIQGGALGSLLKQIGLEPAASFSFSSNNEVKFSYDNVTSVAITPEALGGWLANATPSTNPAVAPYLSGQSGYALFVVTDALQSASISVCNPQPEATSASATAGAAPSSVSASVSDTNQIAETYQGSTPVTFAFKAIGLSYRGGWQFGGPPSGKYESLLSMRGNTESPLGKVLGGISSLFHR
jgi:hypothetical protein